MIAKTTKLVEEAFKAQNWNYNIDEHPDGKNSALITGFDLKSGRSLQIFFISTEMEKGEDLAVRVFQYMTVPEGKLEKAISACNEANGKYRFVRFVCRNNGNIAMEMDMPAETQNVGAVAIELLYRLLDIADDAYPEFEKALA
jgi:hypothetical protein